MSDRDKWLKQCEGFGWDDQLGSGFQANSELCLACADSQPDRYAACVAEAKAGRNKVKKEIIMENENAEQEEVVADQEPVVEPVALKIASGTETEPVVEKAAKSMKADKKPSVMHILANILREGGRSSSELTAELMSRSGCAKASAGSHVAMAVRFGLIVGFVNRDEKGKLELLDPQG